MKKIALYLAIVLIASISSGFINKRSTSDFYIRIAPGSTDVSYQLIPGQKGVDWDCDWQNWNTCIYIKLATNSYQPYENGVFYVIE